VSPVKYELGFYIPEDGILYSHRRGNIKSYAVKGQFTTAWKMERQEIVLSSVLHTKKRENNKIECCVWLVHTRLCESLFKYYPIFLVQSQSPVI
jgi:hypothetical protein